MSDQPKAATSSLDKPAGPVSKDDKNKKLTILNDFKRQPVSSYSDSSSSEEDEKEFVYKISINENETPVKKYGNAPKSKPVLSSSHFEESDTPLEETVR